MPRKQKKYHYIYKTTNVINGKYYIGMHSTDNLDDGYVGSGKRLWFSINYHGKENHKVEILEFCKDREELKKREAEIVNEDLLNEELCLNLIVGGQGGGGLTHVSEESIKRIREGASKWMSKKWEDEEYRKRKSEEAGKRMKINHEMGKIKYDTFTGKKHSEEAKKKMSEAKKGKGIGKTNSQYGTCWVTRNGENKKIKKEDLETYLNEGWEKGRKMK